MFKLQRIGHTVTKGVKMANQLVSLVTAALPTNSSSSTYSSQRRKHSGHGDPQGLEARGTPIPTVPFVHVYIVSHADNHLFHSAMANPPNVILDFACYRLRDERDWSLPIYVI